MVVISDISTIDDIHPKDKKTVGYRLANLALKNHYKVLGGLVESPSFSNVIEIAGDDKLFHPATCKLKNTTIILSSKDVKNPKYVRFAWGNNLQSNLFNKANLPASSFTTDN